MTIEMYLDAAAKSYYNGHPFISDEQFDRLAESNKYTTLGATATGDIYKHYYPLYSLSKVYEDESSNPLEGIDANEIVVTPKLDGAAISALYIDGALVRVLTRGDGKEGTDRTANFLATNVLPLEINYRQILQVTGEIVCHKDVPNSRNVAAGALNLKDVENFKTRGIEFFVHDSYSITNAKTYSEQLRILSHLGFTTVRDPNITEIYPTDGIVYRIDNLATCKKMGYTSKHPKFAYAWKERQGCIETQILDVTWQVGRSGRVTPVAQLEPVMIGAKTIAKATLNNPGFISNLGLCIGDTVGVRLAGMIIPEIVYKAEA